LTSSLIHRLFGTPRPQSSASKTGTLLFSEARRLAEEQARSYKAKHPLDQDEAAVLDSAVINAALFPANDGRWLSLGLAELERFRDVRRSRGSNTAQEVDIRPQETWAAEWPNETLVTIMFEPELHRENDHRQLKSSLSHGGPILFHGEWPAVGCAEVQRSGTSLFIADFWSRAEPFLWKGSKISVAESSTALELHGGHFSSHTTVSASGTLAGPTFDFVSDTLAAQAASCPPEESLWLAIGFPSDGESIPRPRPIEPEQVIDDPLIIEKRARRLCFELSRVPKARSRFDPICGNAIGRWMAVERN
jgi:hypothetical protein